MVNIKLIKKDHTYKTYKNIKKYQLSQDVLLFENENEKTLVNLDIVDSIEIWRC